MTAPRTAHFKASEFSSPGVPKRSDRVPVPPAYHDNLAALMKALETIRSHCGGKPVRVVSGYRTKVYNRQNKGRATRSQHLYAKAADIRVKGMSPPEVYWTIQFLQSQGAIPKGGLACYPTFTHYDIRGYNARWRAAPPWPK